MNEAYDERKCREIWRRVSPELEPYPDAGGEETLPGAAEDPCCMGSEAAESVAVLRGFLGDETADRRLFMRAAARMRTQETRRTLLSVAQGDEKHAKKLSAALYLITGERAAPEQTESALPQGSGCALLRMLYHRKACGGFNYARAAEETPDPCLQKLFADLSAEEYRRAERLLELLANRL